MKVNRAAATALTGAALAWAARAAWGVPAAIGASRAQIQPYAAGSPRYREGRFHNTEPGTVMAAGSESGIAKAVLTRGSTGRPVRPIPLATPLAPAEAGALAVTWYGHSSALIEVDGHRVLADPVWSERVSPSSVLGPARLHPAPMALADLPAIDAIVISHDHYDHLDKETVQILARTQSAPFLVPVGVGAHLRRWQIPEDRIVELDWDEQFTVGDLRLTCTEARHFSGRGFARNTTLWASWVLSGRQRAVFFGGDSGYTPRFADLGDRYGPFDLTLLPVGAYDARWPDIHMNPEEAVRTHADLNAGDWSRGLLVPVHWATFNLAFHPWSEPIVRLLTAARDAGTTTAVPMPGQRIDVLRPAVQKQWWAALG